MKESIMKITHLFPAILSAAMLVSTPVFADQAFLFYETWDPSSSLDSPAVNTRDRPAYVGTSLSDTRARQHIGSPNSAFPNTDLDETGFVVGTAGPEKGNTDNYGSVLYDVGALRY
jgi:hypothetical protein